MADAPPPRTPPSGAAPKLPELLTSPKTGAPLKPWEPLAAMRPSDGPEPAKRSGGSIAGPAEPASSTPEPSEGQGSPSSASELIEVEQRVVKWWHPLAMVLLLGGLFALFDATGLGGDLRSGDLAEMRRWIDGFGVLGPIVFLALYVLATLVGFPGSPLTFAAGALFGSLEGIIVSSVASAITSAVAFVVARHLLSAHVNRWLRHNRRFQQLNRLTRKHGVLVVLTVRLVNVLPFFMVNYGFGVTQVSFKTYVIWSFIGKIPGTIALVLIGDAMYQSVIMGDVPWIMVACVLTLLAALAMALRQLNRRLKQSESESETESQEADSASP